MRSSLLSLALSISSAVLGGVYAHNATGNTTQQYAILDNDWGGLGYIPILLTLQSPIHILGLTSSTADTYQYTCALHALAYLELGNLSSCIPSIQGATYPLLQTYTRFSAWQMVHGKLPWMGVFAPYNATKEALGKDPTGDEANAYRVNKAAFIEGYPNGTLAEGKAAMFMVEQVRKYPGQVSIYAAGALTNVALACMLDDQFASLAKELVIMGGYVDVNMYQATGTVLEADINSDINLIVDPEAAKIALTAPFPNITIVGNAANQFTITEDFLKEMAEVKNPYSELLVGNLETGFPFWDETAAAIMIEPDIVTNFTEVYLDVDIAYASPSYGNIHVYQEALKPPNVRKVKYVIKSNETRFYEMVKQAVQYPPTCASLNY